MRDFAAWTSRSLNRIIECLVAFLMGALVVVVWIGVVDRYVFQWQLPWPEVLARYLMIWMALLAVSCAIVRREHIGLLLFLEWMPERLRRVFLVIADLMGLILFSYLFWYGLDFAVGGLNRQAMVFGLSLAPVFASIPVAAGLSVVQLALTIIRDLGQHQVSGEIARSE